MRARTVAAAIGLLFCAAPFATFAQPAQAPAAPPRATRPPLFLKEDWKQIPGGGEHPVTPVSVTAANVEMRLYGAASREIQLTGNDGDENNPTHVWTGLCTSPCGLTLRDKARFVDLSGLARIKWNIKTSGFHEIRPLVKLADGTWLVGDHTDASTLDWVVSEFSVGAVRWLKVDPERLVTTGNFVDKPDLTRVDEIGFVDLTPASGHGPGGWSDVAQIEVYGKAVNR
jgi:hypothetical protein